MGGRRDREESSNRKSSGKTIDVATTEKEESIVEDMSHEEKSQRGAVIT